MKHFLDVGANVGQTFTDYLNLHSEFDGWDIWCFEPSPRHIPGLMDAVRHQSNRYKIHVCPYGIRGYSGIERFYIKDDPRGDSFEEYLASDHETHNIMDTYSMHVPSDGIITAIYSASKDGDDVVLKLDCEGSEYEILSVLIHDEFALKRITRILVEWHKIAKPVHSSQYLSNAFARVGKPLENWIL